MFAEFDTVELTHDIAGSKLREGTIGAIVNIYSNGTAYEVEFVASNGTTIALLTLKPEDIRPHASAITLPLTGSFSRFTTIYNSNVTGITPVVEENNILNDLDIIVGIDKFNTKLEKDKTTEDVKKYSYLTA